MLYRHNVKPNALAILGIDRLIYNKGLDPRGVISLACSKINLFGFVRMLVQTSVGQGFGMQLLNPAVAADEMSQ